jgi:transposase InsO family protein
VLFERICRKNGIRQLLTKPYSPTTIGKVERWHQILQTDFLNDAGIPEDVVAQLRRAPFRPGLEAIAHTLAYDATIIGDRSLPTELIASVTAPALVISGEQSPPFLRAAAQAVAQALPNGRLSSLPR